MTAAVSPYHDICLHRGHRNEWHASNRRFPPVQRYDPFTPRKVYPDFEQDEHGGVMPPRAAAANMCIDVFQDYGDANFAKEKEFMIKNGDRGGGIHQYSKWGRWSDSLGGMSGEAESAIIAGHSGARDEMASCGGARKAFYTRSARLGRQVTQHANWPLA